MYESFYGLREKPFELHPDPRYLYRSPAHDDVYTHLEYAVQEGKGFVVVSGEIGSGKTLLLNCLIGNLPPEVDVGLVNNTTVGPAAFLGLVCREFDLELPGSDKVSLLTAFNRFLIDRFAQGRRVTLIVDEAQNLPARTLEEVRLLSNLEEGRHHLVQLILVGQPELRERLRQQGLEQLVQRVSVHCHLDRLDPDHVAGYVCHRLEVAGGTDPNLFTSEALDAVSRHSGGIPRVVNLLCDTALVYGFGDGTPRIGADLVDRVAAARAASGLTGTGTPGMSPVGGSPATELELQELIAQVDGLSRRVRELEVAGTVADQRMEALTITDRQLIQVVRALKRQMDRRLVAGHDDGGKDGKGGEVVHVFKSKVKGDGRR